jgi:uncharacterized membrane protein YtjA (UPF0391 family)
MLRWLIVLSVLSVVSGVLASGIFPFGAEGLARVLFGAYISLLAVSLVIGVLRR